MPRRYLILSICCISLFIVGLDNTIVNIALPSLRRDLDASTSGLQWTIDAYTLVIASLLVLAGSTADRVGRRRIFRSGLVLFSLGSLLCSLAPNIIPLIITAGIMGWAGVRLKPSTVIIFSIALGIAIDITIRFLVNYKQEGVSSGPQAAENRVIETINKTGISILYTSMVLIAGFVIFCFSDFGGIFALGWLTSLTLVIATVTNLVFLPALLITLTKGRPVKGPKEG